MSLPLAIDNLKTTLAGITGVAFVPENRAPGNAAYTLSLAVEGLQQTHHFGAVRKIQNATVTMFVKGTSFDISAIAAKQDDILTAIITDRRRGGQAQTTIPGVWAKSEDTGREGVALELPLEIHVLA
jgi:hypothetical protein